jgi:primosomal protein N' (replication factor Y)
MPRYFEIAVNVPQVMGVFHYHLPPALEGRVAAGHLVVVPFGQRTVQGVVLRPVTHPAVPETRPVQALVDPKPALTEVQIALAERISEKALAPLAACISLMVPPGLNQQVDTLYSLSETVGDNLSGLTDLQMRFVKLLERRGPLRGRQLDRSLPRLNWKKSAQALVRNGILTKQSVLPPRSVRPKLIRTAQLACTPEMAVASMGSLGRSKSAALKRRQVILNFLMSEPGPVDVTWVYAESGGNLADLRVLADRDLVRLGESQVWRDPLEGLHYVPDQPPALTPDQADVWEKVKGGLQESQVGETQPPFLLHGVTGSGKTEIYLRAAEAVIQAGRQVIVLVPEIALTAQTVRRFLARFPGQVGLIHSRLSAGERYDTWRRARSGDLGIVIGPRSALFAPLPHLGLIVVDECHDDSYYQFDSPPYYHARTAAVDYAQIACIPCLLGTATPNIVSYQQALQGRWKLLELPARILAHQETIRTQSKRFSLKSKFRPLHGQVESLDLPPVQVIDMRDELKTGNRSIFSTALQETLNQILTQGEQAILFLNRRGTATYIFCRDCGHGLRCPRCDTSLTYHRSRAALTCHHCGYRRGVPATCPQCGSTRIRMYGTGTERVEEEIRKLFSDVRTLRWDWETTRQKGAHEVILSHFANHRADVLIGTQMLAKGLDLPLVTLVGVILADVGLNLPDYRASERTFQVLTQVAGRAGRSPLGGQVILQTFMPDHYVIQSASGHDYHGFFEKELSFRKQLRYPPYTQLVRLEFRHTNPDQAESNSRTMAANIRKWIAAEDRRETDIIGPAPCFYQRLEGQYRWQIILRGPDPRSLLQSRALGGWRVEVDPPSLL